jgi:hypothetical protein
VAIAARRLDHHHLPEREYRRELPRALPVGLAALRGVDPLEPDDLWSASAEDGERVPIGDADDAARERLGRRKADEQDQDGGEVGRRDSRAVDQGRQDGRRLPSPPDAFPGPVAFR